MQSNKSLAFRSRLKTRGYTDVKIKRCRNLAGELVCNDDGEPLYNVYCVEPLLGYDVSFAATESQMAAWPGIPFGNCGYFSRQIDIDDIDTGDAIFV